MYLNIFFWYSVMVRTVHFLSSDKFEELNSILKMISATFLY